MSHSSLSALENNKTKPLRKSKVALAKALGTNFGEDWLDEHLNGEEPPPPTKKEIIEDTSVEEMVSLKFGTDDDPGPDRRRTKEEARVLARMLDKAIEDHKRMMGLPMIKTDKEKAKEEGKKEKSREKEEEEDQV